MTRQELIDTLVGEMDSGDVKETLTLNIDVSYRTGYNVGYEAATVAAAKVVWEHYRSLKDKEPFEYQAYQLYQEIIKLGEEDGTNEEN